MVNLGQFGILLAGIKPNTPLDLPHALEVDNAFIFVVFGISFEQMIPMWKL